MSFATGGFLLLAVLIVAVGLPRRQDLGKAPWYLFTPDLMGIVFVTTMLLLIPEIGALRALAAAVVG